MMGRILTGQKWLDPNPVKVWYPGLNGVMVTPTTDQFPRRNMNMARKLLSLTLALVMALALGSPAWAGGGWGNDGTRTLIAEVDNFKIVTLTKFGLEVITETLLSGAITTSKQAVAGDLKLGAAFVGNSTDARYFAGVMGNVIGTGGSSGTKNIFAGSYGKFDLAGTVSSTYPAAAVTGELGDGTTGARASFLSVVGGDSAATTGIATLSVDWQSSLAASKLDWFLDSQGGGTHDGYKAPRYAKGDIRLGGRRDSTDTSAGEDICISRNAGRPTNGTSGTFAGDCAGSSILIDTTNKTFHYNVNTKASPTWVSLSDIRTEAFAPTASYQPVAGDLNLTATAGSSTAATPAYLAGVMGNVIPGSVNLSATDNIIAGVVGKIDHTGTNASKYPSAGVIAEIGDKAANVDGAFIAAFGGDSGDSNVTGAFYGVSWWQSATASAIDYGLDLEGKAVTGYTATPRYAKAFARYGGRYSNAGVLETVNDVCELFGTAAPTNGVSGTGAGDCGPGSRYTRVSGSDSKLFINTNTQASPTWTVVGSQS